MLLLLPPTFLVLGNGALLPPEPSPSEKSELTLFTLALEDPPAAAIVILLVIVQTFFSPRRERGRETGETRNMSQKR